MQQKNTVAINMNRKTASVWFYGIAFAGGENLDCTIVQGGGGVNAKQDEQG